MFFELFKNIQNLFRSHSQLISLQAVSAGCLCWLFLLVWPETCSTVILESIWQSSSLDELLWSYCNILGYQGLESYFSLVSIMKGTLRNPGAQEHITTSGLVWTNFWEIHIRNSIRDDRFFTYIVIGPDQIMKSRPSWKMFLYHWNPKNI